MWLITNKILKTTKSNITHSQFDGYSFYTNEFENEQNQERNLWFCDGYFLPRRGLNFRYASLSPVKLLNELFRNLGNNLIEKIKGNFILIQLLQNGFKIFSDRFGIKKFFYWQNEDEFAISNDLKKLSKLVKFKASSVGMVVYTLTCHFTGGRTAYENVFHNQPGEYIEFGDGVLKFNTYWKPEELLNIPKRHVEIKEILGNLRAAVSSTMVSSEPISLSLTGGADTRNLLSIFLSLGLKPHLYTYGNPYSNDCVKASTIAKGLGLQHHVHDIQMTPELFEKTARRIIQKGGGLASIHRAHRLLAVDLEKQFASKMYLGTLGGEFIKGVSEDNYIVPDIVYENWRKSSINSKELEKYMESKRLIATHDVKEQFLSYLHTESFMNGHVLHRKHLSLSNITAHLHDAQDVNLYETVMDQVCVPFLDIDYLETLFASEFTFNNKEVFKNPYLRRIQNPVYGAEFIQASYPPLLKFKYSGEHKPSEILFNKYLAALVKAVRLKSGKKYPPNFPIGKWMYDFLKNQLLECKNFQEIRTVYDLNKLMQDLENEKFIVNEAYWLKYTNPVMMRYILEEFCYE